MSIRNKEGKKALTLSSLGYVNYLDLYNNEEVVTMSLRGRENSGGIIHINDSEGKLAAFMAVDRYGGHISIWANEGDGLVSMGVTELGGPFHTLNWEGRGAVQMNAGKSFSLT